MNSFGQSNDDHLRFGRYAQSKQFEYKSTIQYTRLKDPMNELQFLEFLETLRGIVMLDGNDIWYNGADNDAILLLRFDERDQQYGDQIMWKHWKDPKTGEFERTKPYDWCDETQRRTRYDNPNYQWR